MSVPWLRVLFLLLLSAAFGCAGTSNMDKQTLGWIRVETEDLVIRTDVDADDAVELAKRYQRLRTAIAQNEFPCAFERGNAPMELVILKDERELEAIGRRYDIGFPISPPSNKLDAKTQLAMTRRGAGSYTQLFVGQLAYGAMRLCFPEAPPWFVEGMSSFYETARMEGDELVIGMPRYAFVESNDTEPSADIYDVHANRALVTVIPRRRAPDFDELRRLDVEGFYRRGRKYRTPDDFIVRDSNYAGSWLAIHMFQLGEPSFADAFALYLGSLSRGVDDEQAWKDAFGGIDVAARYDDYLVEDFAMGRRPVDLSRSSEPLVTSILPVDVALLRAQMWGWRTDAQRGESLAYIDYAAQQAPTSPEPMLYRAAWLDDRGDQAAAEGWLQQAIDAAPNDPETLATAILWYARRRDLREDRRADLDRWGETLRGSAQNSFQFQELGEYLLRVKGDREAALEALNRALFLDATRWRTYALAGDALRDLGRREEAIRAYYTAIGLSRTQGKRVRAALKEEIAKLEAQR
ncbi:MAG: tetratricopeptide repeat protein [Myxococcota bacterium]